MQIRRATQADLAGLCRLLDAQNAYHVKLLPGFFRLYPTEESRVLTTLEDPNAEILIAEQRDRLLGLIELRITHTKDLPILVQKAYATIQEMIVDKEHRGQGIGTRLMEASRLWARDRGAESIRTSVVPGNDRARAFYAQHGFREMMLSLESEIELPRNSSPSSEDAASGS